MAIYKDKITININGLNDFGEPINDSNGAKESKCAVSNYKYSSVENDGNTKETWTLDVELPFRKIQPCLFISESLKNNTPIIFTYDGRDFKFTDVGFDLDQLGRVKVFKFNLESK